MGFLDRLLGRTPPEQQRQSGYADGPTPASRSQTPADGRGAPSRPGASEDERAVARYRYLLRTAPPEQLEALHAEAFTKLTPEQRQQLLRELSNAAPALRVTSTRRTRPSGSTRARTSTRPVRPSARAESG